MHTRRIREEAIAEYRCCYARIRASKERFEGLQPACKRSGELLRALFRRWDARDWHAEILVVAMAHPLHGHGHGRWAMQILRTSELILSLLILARETIAFHNFCKC